MNKFYSWHRSSCYLDSREKGRKWSSVRLLQCCRRAACLLDVGGRRPPIFTALRTPGTQLLRWHGSNSCWQPRTLRPAFKSPSRRPSLPFPPLRRRRQALLHRQNLPPPMRPAKYLAPIASHHPCASPEPARASPLRRNRTRRRLPPRRPTMALQGFTSNATTHDCNTTDLVAIGGAYCNLSVKWLQYVPIMQRTKCVAICVISHCNRRVLLQPF
jgi:hypothetical protein